MFALEQLGEGVGWHRGIPSLGQGQLQHKPVPSGAKLCRFQPGFQPGGQQQALAAQRRSTRQWLAVCGRLPTCRGRSGRLKVQARQPFLMWLHTGEPANINARVRAPSCQATALACRPCVFKLGTRTLHVVSGLWRQRVPAALHRAH